MEYCQLGQSGISISRIGFGCMSLKSNERTGIPLVHQALEGGINYFDTADLYEKGANELLLGKALAGKRHQVVIATKAGNQWRDDGSGWDWNPSKNYILKAAEQSLQRLGTDYIDLYQLHGGMITDPIDETIEAFELLLQQGKIRSYGISSIRPNVIREWIKRSHIASVMMQYSLLDRRPEEECLNLLQEKRISVLARGSLAQGLLAGKPAKEYLGYAREEVEKASYVINQLAESPSNTLDRTNDSSNNAAAIALQFTLHHPAIASAVVGIHTQEQLEQALQIDQIPMLRDEDYSKLQRSTKPNQYTEHR